MMSLCKGEAGDAGIVHQATVIRMTMMVEGWSQNRHSLSRPVHTFISAFTYTESLHFTDALFFLFRLLRATISRVHTHLATPNIYYLIPNHNKQTIGCIYEPNTCPCCKTCPTCAIFGHSIDLTKQMQLSQIAPCYLKSHRLLAT